MSKLIESVHTLVIDGDMPAKAIASAIGKPYSTCSGSATPMAKAQNSAQRRSWQSSKPQGTPSLLKSWRGNSVINLFLSIDDPCIKGAADLPSPQPMRGPEAQGDVRPRRGWPRRVLWKGINLCITHITLYI